VADSCDYGDEPWGFGATEFPRSPQANAGIDLKIRPRLFPFNFPPIHNSFITLSVYVI
jgi:hypothetical protein